MILEITIITIYSIALILIFIYSLAQLNLLFNYLNAKKREDTSEKFDINKPDETPFVTIQLPIYNMNCM